MFPTHHVLSKSFASHRVIQFLANRFDINGIRNLMVLPATQGLADDLTSSPHTGGHLGSYYAGFKKHLDAVEASVEFRAGVAGGEGQVDKVVSDLNKLVAAAKYAQANGHLFPNTPTGMTREQANAANEKWFENWRRYAEENEDQIREMLDTINQLSASRQWNGALHWPILSPTSTLSLEDRIKIRSQFRDGSPISQHFTAIGPVPALPGLVPSFVNTRLPGFIPVSPDDVKQPEGFSPSNPSLPYGLRGFPAANPDWQRFGQLPPSTAAPSDPFILKFDPATGAPLPFHENPLMRDPGSQSSVAQDVLPWLFGGAALGVAAPFILSTLPAWLWALATLGTTGAIVGSSANAKPGNNSSGGVFATGAPQYNPFNTGSASNASGESSRFLGSQSSAPSLTDNAADQEAARPSTFNDRFGNWPGIQDLATSSQSLSYPQAPAAASAGATAPDEVRRLTRVNTSNAGSVFESGTAPVPYLPSPEFDDRFGNWRVGQEGPQQISSPVGAFADEPSYAVPPPIWGLEASVNPRNDAEEWFSRWIQPLLRQD